MDLFVVNRYNAEEKPAASDEKTKLDKVLKKIKKRKLAREKKRQKENIKLKKVSKFAVKKHKVKIIKTAIKAKREKGQLLSKKEAKEALDKKVMKVKDLVEIKGQVLPTKKSRKIANELIKKGIVKLDKTEKKTKKIKKKEDETIDKSKNIAKKLIKKEVVKLDKTEKKTKKKKKDANELIKKDVKFEETEQKTKKKKKKETETVDTTKKTKKKRKADKEIIETEKINEKQIEELSAEEIAENLLKKQLENSLKTTDSDDDKPKKKKPKKLSPENIEGFTILGVDKFAKKKTVKRVLPKWLRNPTVISSDLTNLDQKISKTELNTQLKQKLKEKHIKYLFPVQAEFIPWQLKNTKTSGLIAPPDACISAPTGSGKTLAFTIPVLQNLLEQLENRCLTVKAIRALIILPTQSLALQIYDTFKSLISESELNVGLATGAGNRTLQTEQKQLITYNSIWGSSSKVDILICTAGRLVDHLKSTKGFDLKHLQYIIIDEADRVLDSIQDDWLYHLGIHLRQDSSGNLINRNVVNVVSVKQRTDPQKLLFSATLSQDPEKLQKLSLFQPKLFTCISETENTNIQDAERFIGKYTTPAELNEKYIICTIEIKPLVLYKLIIDEIDKNKQSRILVFVNTVETLHRLNVLLKYMGEEKFTVAEFSSSQGNLKARQTLLKKFEDGLIQVLVCTDSMARGIDIPNVDCVISYSVPNHLKTYIHRAGRTARAGTSGLCISMMHEKQQKTFLSMIDNMRSQTKNVEQISIPNEDLEVLTPLYEQCLVQLKEKVNDEIEMNALKIKTQKLAFNNKKKNRNLRKKMLKKTA